MITLLCVLLLVSPTGCAARAPTYQGPFPAAASIDDAAMLVSARLIGEPLRVAFAEAGQAAPSGAALAVLRQRQDLVAQVLPLDGSGLGPRSRADGQGGATQMLLARAREAGADCLLLVTARRRLVDRAPPPSFTEAYTMPRNRVEVEARCLAVLIDVESGKPLATGSAHRRGHASASSLVSDGALARESSRVLEAAQSAAVEAALDQLSRRSVK